MRIIFGIIAFPFVWIAIYVYRIVVVEILWGFICLISRILNPIHFVLFLISWVFFILIDLIYSIYASTVGAIDFVSDIMFKDEHEYGTVFTNQRRLFTKYERK